MTRERRQRRWRLLAALAVASLLAAAALAAPAASDPASVQQPARGQAKPNIVFVLVDDMRADEMRFMPATRRWIGDEGVTFDNSFAPNPLCCPARASILTGLYTHSHKVYWSAQGFGFTPSGTAGRCRCGCAGPGTTPTTSASTSTGTAPDRHTGARPATRSATSRRAGRTGSARSTAVLLRQPRQRRHVPLHGHHAERQRARVPQLRGAVPVHRVRRPGERHRAALGPGQQAVLPAPVVRRAAPRRPSGARRPAPAGAQRRQALPTRHDRTAGLGPREVRRRSHPVARQVVERPGLQRQAPLPPQPCAHRQGVARGPRGRPPARRGLVGRGPAGRPDHDDVAEVGRAV